MARPEVGDPAPDALLTDLERREVRLSSLWKERPAVVVFLRYFGCPFCQTQVVTLRNEHERIRSSGADVGLVGHGDPEAAIEFASSKGLPFPLLLDRDRGTYRAYGLVQGKAMQVLSPRVALPWIRAELSSETRQRGLKGGDFLPDARHLRGGHQWHGPSPWRDGPHGSSESELRGRAVDRPAPRDFGQSRTIALEHP